MIKPGKYSAPKTFSSKVINIFAKEDEDQQDEEEEEEGEEQEQEEQEQADYFEKVRCSAWVNSALRTSHISLLNTTFITPWILTPSFENFFNNHFL